MDPQGLATEGPSEGGPPAWVRKASASGGVFPSGVGRVWQRSGPAVGALGRHPLGVPGEGKAQGSQPRDSKDQE